MQDDTQRHLIRAELKKAYDAMFERLSVGYDVASFKRAFCFGYSISDFLAELHSKSACKIFVVEEDGATSLQDDLILNLKGAVEEKLNAFPPKTFSFIASLWSPRALKDDTLVTIRKILKDDGIFAMLIARDNSPALVMDFLRESGIRLKKAGYPGDVSFFRAILEGGGFPVNGVWQGEFAFAFKDVQECIENIKLLGLNKLFEMAEEKTDELKENLLDRLSNLLKEEGEIKVEYGYLGAICVI